MLAVWYSILAAIDICNKIVQVRGKTLDEGLSSSSNSSGQEIRKCMAW